MDINRKCKNCSKELGEFDGHIMPSSMPATAGFAMPSGGADTFCDKCYENMTCVKPTKGVSEKNDKFIKNIINYRETHPEFIAIKNLEVGKNEKIVGVINLLVEKTEYEKDGRTLVKHSVDIADDTSTINLIWWDDQEVTPGKIYIVEGYVKEFRGEKQFTLGKHGNIREGYID